jgi:flagellar hook-length control protein FliK
MRLWMGEMAAGPKPTATPVGPTLAPQRVANTPAGGPILMLSPRQELHAAGPSPLPADATQSPDSEPASRPGPLPPETGHPATKEHRPPAQAADGTPVAPGTPPTEGAPVPFMPATDQRPIHPLGQSHITSTQPPAAPPPAQQIAGALEQLTTPRPDRIELVLAPEDLGRLRFDMTQHGESLHVILSAERPETLDLLRRSLPDLLAELRQAGVQAGSFSFGQWSENGPKTHQSGHDRQDDKETAAPSALPPPPPQIRPAAGLDLRL